MTLILLGTFLVLLILNVPVVFCMLISSLTALVYADVNILALGLETSRNMASLYPMIAVPFFILAGDLMNRGGLSEKIINLSQSLFGRFPGGLAIVTTTASMFFGAISGASSATCAAIGGVMIPAMAKRGYERPFACALAACSGTTGALIPPSMVLLFYGALSNQSIEKMFMGGIFPGILIGIGIIIMSILYARAHKVPIEKGAGVRVILKSLRESFFAFVLVLIIFGGILGGIFTATEAAAVAVSYSFFVGFFIYRKLKVRDLPGIVVGAAKTTANLTFLISAAGLFAWVLALGFVPEAITRGLLEGSEKIIQPFAGHLNEASFFVLKKYIVLFTLTIALLVIGMFVDAGPAIIILTPVVHPLGQALGMSPIHFGVMVVTNLVIGLITPPVGTTLFVASAIGRIRLDRIVPFALKFMLIMVAMMVLIIVFPFFTTWLPGFIK